MAWNLINSLHSLATNLLPSITASVQAPSSSSNSNNSEKECARAVEKDLQRLMRTLKRIKATLYDVEEREIIDRSVKFWLKELKKVAYDAEDVLGEYRYEATRVQVEARKASEASGSHKRKDMEYIVQIPHGMVDRLHKIRSRFDEIAKDREALQLRDSDGVRRPNNKIVRPPTSHMVDETSIFGRNAEIKEVVDFLRSENKKPFSVLSIIGKGGLGKTTIAQLVYKDERVTRCFDLFGWVCVSEEFEVRRLIKATIESISKIKCIGVSELSPLQEELAQTVKEKTILLVLDDVWNENQSLWEKFQVPFKEAKQVRVLMTTRNEKVAKIMQTTACFRPPNLPEDFCWKLFQHYAFSGTSDTIPKHLVDVGWEIMKKCGGLPLVVKSIASLLRYTTDEERWREILESDFWESNSSNDIFPVLQISYDHLPHHLKPCFLLCSMYPKDYEIEKINLIELWISHGYIESSGKRRIKEIADEYYEELKERSFLDGFSHGSKERCKLHDIIHDLARLNSENEHYSVQINQPLDIQEEKILKEAYHLYASGFFGFVNPILRQNMNGLRTLSMDLRACGGDVQICNLTNFKALRVLELKGNDLKGIPDSISELKLLAYLDITCSSLKMFPRSIGLLYNLQTLILDCSSLEYLPDSISDFKHLAYLHIISLRLKMLPRSIDLLYNLRTLILHCRFLEYLPESIGDLLNLQLLDICSQNLRSLPESIGDLLNLQFLDIRSENLRNLPKSLGSLSNLSQLRLVIKKFDLLDYVPHGLVNFSAIKKMTACLRVKTLDWLKDMTGLDGNLSIYRMSNLKDAQRANLRNKCKLQTLNLIWFTDFKFYDLEESHVKLMLKAEACEDKWVGVNDEEFSWLESLQPHPNLKKLQVKYYCGATLPGWMSDPSSLQSIQEVLLENCEKIQSLPFSNLHTLKHLTIHGCVSIRVLHLEQLPSQLDELHIEECVYLELITGLGNLDMLATLEIWRCPLLKSITVDGLQLVESTKPFSDSSHEKPLIGRQSISSLTRLKIHYCDMLCVMPEGLIPSGPFCVHVNVDYHCATLPGRMSDPPSLQSIQEVLLEHCVNIQSLPFSNLHTLKHLTIHGCTSIRVLELEQLPSQLEELHIVQCVHLELITGLGNLDMLATLEIYSCHVLKSIKMDGLQLVESTKPFSDSSHEKPIIGKQSISSLTRLIIEYCDMLCVLPEGLIPSGPFCVRVNGCANFENLI